LFATSNIVLNYALCEQPLVNGLIISAPFLRTPDPIPAAKLLLARIMKNVWGGWRENNALKIDKLSHLPEVKNTKLNKLLFVLFFNHAVKYQKKASYYDI
jgi:alpha-beta hydrolase superfamily lysophospholipase